MRNATPIRRSGIAAPLAGVQAMCLRSRGAGVEHRKSIGMAIPFLVGLFLPMISLQATVTVGAVPGFWDRIAVVDVLILVAVGCAALVRGLCVSRLITVYLCALAVAAFVGVTQALTYHEALNTPVAESIALLAATAYWVVGFSVIRTRSALPLVVGIACGVMWESVIVFHDWWCDNQWFVDKMDQRVRGTFRKNGQLAAYGFSVAGLLLTVGVLVTRRSKWRALVVVAGSFGILFSVAAARRSGLFAIFAWMVGYLILAAPRSHRFLYCATVLLVGCGGLFAFSHVELWENSFFGKRLFHGVERLESLEDDFLYQQVVIAIDNIHQWLPFGMGIGRGRTLMGGTEFHNLYLALPIELGLLCTGAFAVMVFAAYRGLVRASNAKSHWPWVASFLVAAAFFSVHNRLHRDRAFMLFLGLSTGLPAAARRFRPSAESLPSNALGRPRRTSSRRAPIANRLPERQSNGLPRSRGRRRSTSVSSRRIVLRQKKGIVRP